MKLKPTNFENITFEKEHYLEKSCRGKKLIFTCGFFLLNS